MKILFVYTNIGGYHFDTYHFGIASIISCVREAGHNSSAVIVHNKKDYQRVLDEVKTFNPQIVAFTSVSSQFSFVVEISEEIKKINPKTMIVCGGTHPTIYPDCITEVDAIDGIFIGECEQSFPDFVKMVENNDDYCSCDNFCYSKDGLLMRNKLRPQITDLDIVPYPDKTVYPYAETIEKTGFASFFFSRGCPFTCTYCSNHAIARANGFAKSITRYRSPESSIKEIEETLELFPYIKKLIICDDIFGINKKWRREFLKIYIERIKMPFICLLRADVITDEFIRTLKEAGCISISLGLESGNEYIRNEVMGRNMSQQTIIDACNLIQKYGMRANTLNIIGIPGETEEMLMDTIKLNRLINPASSGVNIFYPYKGTVLGDACFKDGLVDIDRFSNFSNERRESILNYDKTWHKKLTWYHSHWQRLIYPNDKQVLIKYYKDKAHNILGNTPVWMVLRSINNLQKKIRNYVSM